jgi:hypothetical protein
MEKHIAKEHPAGNTNDVHSHENRAKYVFLSGDDHARRVDVNPLAFRRRFRTGRSLLRVCRVYFAIEGCLKADAILTAILKTGEDASVINVPSVTLWDTPDLEFLANHFLDPWSEREARPEVVIVPDADWFSKPEVLTQALLCRSLCRRLGFETCIAAAPIWPGLQECECKPMGECVNAVTCKRCGGYFKGVDDFLAAGGMLGGLFVLHREAPVHHHLIDLKDMRSDKRVNCSKMLTALAEHSDNDGGFEGSIPKLARVTDFKRRTAYQVITDYLVGERIITVDRPTLLKRKQWIRGKGYVAEFDWEDRPKFILPPQLRADPFKFFRLCTWHNDEREDMDKLLIEVLHQKAQVDDRFTGQDAKIQELQATVEALKAHLPSDDQVARVVDLFIQDALAA